MRRALNPVDHSCTGRSPMKFFRCISLSFLALLVGVGVSAGEEAPSTIPLTLVQSAHDGGRIYVPLRFGSVMGAMRLDTGASTTRIALASWNKDLPSLGQSQSTGASGNTGHCEDVEAKNVELKATQGNNIARAKYVVSRCSASDGADLLGVDFFKGARFTLDFQRHELVFFGDWDAARHPRPFRLLGPEQRLVGIDLVIGNTPAIGLFDTGAELSAVDQKFVESHKRLFTRVKTIGKASAVGGKSFSAKLYLVKKIDFGEGRILRGVYALVYDFGALREALGPQTPFILGYNFISRFTWELDFKSPNSPTWDAKPR